MTEEPKPQLPDDRPGRLPGVWTVLAVLFGLTGFAIAQPLLSLAGANPTLFVFNRVSPSQMVGLAVAIVFVPPLLAWLAITVAGRVRTGIGRWLYRIIVALLALLSGIWIGREVGLGIGSVAVGLVVSGLAVYAVTRSPTATEWLRYTAILPFVALGVFLFASESSALLQAANEVERSEVATEYPSVVFLLLDELPTLSLLADDGTIDSGRFPNFARLADESTWYPNYTTLSGLTETAVPTMLTGRDPELGQPLWTNHPDNLFSLLAPTHGLTVHESFTKLCGVSTCSEAGPTQGQQQDDARLGSATNELVDLWADRLRGTDRTDALADFEESTEPPEIEFDGPGGVFPDDEFIRQWPSRFGDFVDSLVPGEDPSLYYLHLLLPHFPWQWYPDGQLYAAPPDPAYAGLRRPGTPWTNALDEHRHLMQLQYVDGLLGDLMNTLEEQNMFDSTALVVVADHGVSFEIGKDVRALDEVGRTGTAFVPLFVKQPDQRDGRIDDRNLMAIDLLSLVADLVGVEVPWEVDGLAPDDPGVAARGSEKYDYSVTLTGFVPTSIEGPNGFDGVEYRPSASDRAIRSSQPDDGELDALLELLDRSGSVGKSVAELALPPGGEVSVLELESVLENDQASASVFVQGAVTDTSRPVEVLVAVDGEVVSGSRVDTADGELVFVAMLPSSSTGRRESIDVILVDEEGEMTLAVVNAS